MKRWKIIDIVHSGRKGIRWKPVTDSKYDDLKGCTCVFDLEDLEALKSFRFNFMSHPLYKYWDVSAVISAATKNDYLFLETVNAIYVLEEVKAKEKLNEKTN